MKMCVEYFVMLNCEDGENITPLMDDKTGQVVRFKGPEKAIDAADRNDLGCTYGYEVFVVQNGGVAGRGPAVKK